MPELAIVIVSYNCRNELHACLQSLAVSRPSVPHQTVVVDNASTDGTVAYLRDHWTGVVIEEPGQNLGFARANNLGIRRTAADFVLLLNPDTIVRAGAIDQLMASLVHDPDAAIAGPRIVDRHGRAEVSYGEMTSPLAEWRQRALVRGNDQGVPQVVERVDRMTREAKRVDWVTGACLLIRRADLDAVGLLDERYFMYFEDIDLCSAVRARGRHVLFAPDSEIVHLRGRSAASAPRHTRDAYRRSQLAFYRKHRPAWALALSVFLKVRGQYPPSASAAPALPR